MSIRILYIGRSEYLFETIKYLSNKYETAGIITAPASPEYGKNERDFEELSKSIKCPFLLTKKIDNSVLELVEKIKPDIALSVNWVSIINNDLIELIPNGILNAHFGDIPKYRGNAVTNWALLNFEKEITLTVHKMEAENLDSGQILAQQKMTLTNTTTISEIVDYCYKNTPKLFHDAIDNIINDNLPKPTIVNSEEGFRCYPRLPENSKIDWTDSAKNIDALIRASTKPYSGAYSYIKLNGEIRKVTIWSCRIVCDSTNDMGTPGHIIKNDKKAGESHVYTGKGIIALRTISLDKENKVSASDVFKSIRIKFGIDIEEEIIEMQSKLIRLEKNDE